ncbi:JHBP domain-containing protein, partial [Aphanizomenon sp. 202]|nr:JHBP domain-containing protein [Aphanizomenon sp. 202]
EMTLAWLLCFLAAVAGLQAGPSAVRNVIDDQIIAALENFRTHMVDGWPELGVPPLYPMVLSGVSLDVTSGTTHLPGSRGS